MKIIKNSVKTIIEVPKNITKMLIRAYQKTLSTDHAFWAKPEIYRVCIHQPSCSEYTYQAIDRFGFARGSVMGFFRVLRCNPWSEGGYDPVPDRFSIKRNAEKSTKKSKA